MDSYLFDLTPQLLHDAVLSMIAVFTLFLVASHFLFNPVREMMKKRQEKIQGELEDAKQNQEAAQGLKTEYEEKLKNVGKEAEEIVLPDKRHLPVKIRLLQMQRKRLQESKNVQRQKQCLKNRRQQMMLRRKWFPSHPLWQAK